MYYALPMVESNRFPILKAIVSRYINIILPVMAMVAVDLIWPLLGCGPYYTIVADFVASKCSKNWWANLFLVNNFLPALDICVPQTYFSSTVFQLFVVSIPILFMFHKRPLLAKVLCSLIISSSYMILYWVASVKDISPSLFVSLNPSGQKTVDYIDYATIKIYCYISPYFIGFWLGHYARKTFERTHHDWRWNLWRPFFGGWLQIMSTFAAILYNSFYLLPDFTVPLFMVIVRILMHIAMSQYILFSCCFSTPPNLKPAEKDENNNGDGESSESRRTVLSEVTRIVHCAVRPLSKLAVAFYLTNYFFIRFDFFTSRFLFTHQWYFMIQRNAYGMVYMIATAGVFHLLFVAPIDAIRRELYARIEQKSNHGHKNGIRRKN